MEENKINCEHACKNTCEALKKALKGENSILEIYSSVVDECTLPEAKAFLAELIDEKNKVVKKLEQKMHELMEKSHIIDDITESYNKEVE